MDLKQGRKVLGVQSFVPPRAFLSNLAFKLCLHRAYQRETKQGSRTLVSSFVSEGLACATPSALSLLLLVELLNMVKSGLLGLVL